MTLDSYNDSLRAVIREDAARGAAERTVPAESVKALTEAGLFRIMTPKPYGGAEAGIRTLLDVSASVAEADGGAGWVIALTGICAWAARFLPLPGQDEIFGAGPDTVLCGSAPPVGVGSRTPDGWRVSGRWGYVSGSLHADWAMLGFRPDPGYPEAAVAFVPVRDLTLTDTWHTAGMRSTGSNTLAASEVLVPEHRVLFPEAAVPLGPAWFPALALTLAGPLLGLGQAALQYVAAAADGKPILTTKFTRQAESAGFQLQFAEAAQRIDTARLHAFRAADDVESHMAGARQLDYATGTRVRADAALAARQVVAALTVLLDAHGASGFAEASPLHRIWLDTNVAARHAAIAHAVSHEAYGKALLGIAPDDAG